MAAASRPIEKRKGRQMATRRGGSLPTIISLVVVIILAMAGFITSVVFFSQSDRYKNDLEAVQAQYDSIINRGELDDERVVAAQRASGNESVVSALIAQNRQLKELIAGTPDAVHQDVLDRADQRGIGGGSLIAQIGRLSTRVDSLQNDLDQQVALREAAQADATNEANRVQTIRTGFEEAVSSAQSEINSYGGGVDDLRRRVDEFVQTVLTERDEERALYDRLIDERDRELAEANQNALVLRDQIARLRGEGNISGIRPPDEYALIDGRVVGRDTSDGQVLIDLGADDKVQIGQIFSVYSEAADLRPDPRTGEYAPGKAAIEVIRVDRNGARARVIRSSRGNPVVRGDLIASPVYDPNKVYRFVVYGNFDVNGDGVRSELERLELATLIRRWGGEVQDDIAGDTDFLVLGEKPVLPPAPGQLAPPEVVEHYVLLDRKVAEYDRLLREARASSLPVLNENRLRTLIGAFPE